MTDAPPPRKILIRSINTNMIMYNIFRCSDCQKLAPEFERAATELGTKSADLAKVLFSIIKNQIKIKQFYFLLLFSFLPLFSSKFTLHKYVKLKKNYIKL